MKYYHVDVFSSRPMSGSGLTVVFADKDIENAQMLEITQEFRQFETAFIFPQNSTGLPYLIVPVRDIEHARISGKGFEAFLDSLGAKFVYVFDPQTLECRTWDNDGLAEDVATGSAAGPLCAYLVRHGIKKQGEVIRLKQGRHVGRPSEMEGWMEDGNVFIRGGVSFFALGELFWQRNFGGAL